MYHFRKIVSVISVVSLLFLMIPDLAMAEDPFTNCRLGVAGSTDDGAPDFTGPRYDIENLNMGLYLDWASRSTRPQGLPADIEYIQMIRVHQNKVGSWPGNWDNDYASPPSYSWSPGPTSVSQKAIAQPGSLWLIGNEIDRRDWYDDWFGQPFRQDEITPELYAKAFHDIQAIIKNADPTARVAIGSVVFISPLRLKYLDRVWETYYDLYGYPMGEDIDVWNMHGFILPEVADTWGAEIPAGLESPRDFLPEEGMFYCDSCGNNMNSREARAGGKNVSLFKEATEELRRWMAAHGEQNKPLINTEYAILNNEFDNDIYRNYLSGTFDYMFNATDENLGYPADENRLVQGWVWFSMNASHIYKIRLYDGPWPKQRSYLGNHWYNYVQNSANTLAYSPQVNLLATDLRIDPLPTSMSTGEEITVTLRANIANSGNTKTATGDSIEVTFLDDTGTPIGTQDDISDIPGCGRFVPVEMEWTDRAKGHHNWSVVVTPILGETSASDIGDNTADSEFWINPTADLEVVKTVNNTPYSGLPVEYTIVVTNNGSFPASDIKINDDLPEGLSFSSADATDGYYNHKEGVWKIGFLTSTATSILTLTARVASDQAGNTITNTAIVSSAARVDTVTDNDKSSVSIVPLESEKVYLPVVLKKG